MHTESLFDLVTFVVKGKTIYSKRVFHVFFIILSKIRGVALKTLFRLSSCFSVVGLVNVHFNYNQSYLDGIKSGIIFLGLIKLLMF